MSSRDIDGYQGWQRWQGGSSWDDDDDDDDDGNEKGSSGWVGPWGGGAGAAESPWDGGVSARRRPGASPWDGWACMTGKPVLAIDGAAVESIHFKADRKQSSVLPGKEGDDGGAKTGEGKGGVVKVGPWGCLRGRNAKDVEGVPTRLLKITIRYGGCIESIRFQYEADGVSRWTSTWGSNAGSTAEVDLGTRHFLTDISGHYGNYNGYVVVRSLKFESTLGPFGPFGKEEGTHFSLPVKQGKVVGFFGASGQWLDALGVYLRPS